MKQAAFLHLLVWAAAGLQAQTVAEDVLKGQEILGVEFRNYEGPHAVIESRQAIQGIGVSLGQQIKTDPTAQADFAGKYSVLRLHDPASDKLSADLLILSPQASVDHIRNLNWIVSYYLQTVFGYSVTDGDLLASFVTRYNAWYRGKLDYFGATYIPAVVQNVSADNVGLSTLWSDWPGKTRIVIPLRDSLSKGLAGGVNTEEISNKDVVKQMATEPGAGLDDRKKLADLKEAEIVKEQKAVAQAEAKMSAPAGTSAAPASTTDPTKAAATPATPPTTTTSPVATTTPAATATPATTPATLPVAEAKKDLAARDQALQAERQDIVKKENQQPTPATPTAAKAPASTLPFVRMTEGTKAGQLWFVDPATQTVWKKSTLNSIRQPSAPAFGAGLLVVAGDAKAANGAIRLLIVSKDDGSVLTTGADDVNPDAVTLVQGGQVYALTKGDKGGWVLGLFDAQLKLVAKGTDALTSVTALVPGSAGIYVQSAGGSVLVLDAKTLKLIATVEG